MIELPECWNKEKLKNTDEMQIEHLNPNLNLPPNIMDQLKQPRNTFYQLPILYFITVLNGYKTVVEIGSGGGSSAACLASAVKETGGHLFSVDWVYQNYDKYVKDWQLDEYVTWIIDDDRRYVKYWRDPIDHLFIDSSHKYGHTLWELKEWGKFVKPNGSITLHDITLGGPPSLYDKNHPIKTAIQDFLQQCQRKTIYKEIVQQTLAQENGLGWIYFEK